MTMSKRCAIVTLLVLHDLYVRRDQLLLSPVVEERCQVQLQRLSGP